MDGSIGFEGNFALGGGRTLTGVLHMPFPRRTELRNELVLDFARTDVAA